MIAHPDRRIRQMLPDIFPGCQIETWEPLPPQLRGTAKRAFEYIVQHFETSSDLLPHETVRAALQVDRSNYNRSVQQQTALSDALNERAIYEERQGRRRVGYVMEPETDDEQMTAADYGFVDETTD